MTSHLIVRSGQGLGGTVRFPAGVGGYVDWSLAVGTYVTFTAVAAGLENALDVAIGGAGTWTVTRDAGSLGEDGFTIERVDGFPFDITVDPGLVSYCGLPAADTNTSSHKSDTTPAYGFWPSYPLAGPANVWYQHARSYGGADGQAPTGAQWSTVSVFEAEVLYLADEQTQFRSWLRHAQAGVPFRLWVDSSDGSAWSPANPDGLVDLVLAHDASAAAEEPMSMAGMLWRYRIAGLVQ